MVFHVVGLPHTLPTKAYVHCAYSQKVRLFVEMMRACGHTVHLYTSDEPLPPSENLTFPFEPTHPAWLRQNHRAILGIQRLIQPDDIICLIAGRCQQSIADAFPRHLAVEFGVGYFGTFANHCVFESYAHMANVYGQKGITMGRFGDEVIPNSYDIADFPFVEEKADYLLFVGRLNHDKGIDIASATARHTGKRLVVCGQGTPPTGSHVEYHGLVDAEERGVLMSHARALLAPSLYLEPFGGVAVEAQLCGTPVITTDWGAFPETVAQGVSGFRCRTPGEFVHAVQEVSTLSPAVIRDRAVSLYSTETVQHLYNSYFRRVLARHVQDACQVA